MKYRVEVIADETGQWIPNAMRFESLDEAEKYARNLAWNWTACRQWRVLSLAGRMASWRIVRTERMVALA